MIAGLPRDGAHPASRSLYLVEEQHLYIASALPDFVRALQRQPDDCLSTPHHGVLHDGDQLPPLPAHANREAQWGVNLEEEVGIIAHDSIILRQPAEIRAHPDMALGSA